MKKNDIENKKRLIERINFLSSLSSNDTLSINEKNTLYESNISFLKDLILDFDICNNESDSSFSSSNSSGDKNMFDTGTDDDKLLSDNDDSFDEHNLGVYSLETVESYKSKVARDLHDSIVQSLTLLIHKSELVQKMLDKDDKTSVKLELQSIITILQDQIDDLREIIYEMRPMALDNIGLPEALESYFRHISNYADIQFSISTKDLSDRKIKLLSYLINNGADSSNKHGSSFNSINDETGLSDIAILTLYRIAQEAFSNIIKYSKCKSVEVEIIYLPDSVKLTIYDDGIGFDIKKSLKNTDYTNSGFGIHSMIERARILKGKCNIESKIGKGTRIEILIPTERKK